MGEEYIQGNQPDLSGLLGNLLQNPAALSMLSSLLAGSLGGKGNSPPPKNEPCETECCGAPQPCLSPAPPRQPDNRTCLLNALRPYLSPSRCNTIDSLLRILELMELLRKRR
ncbi:MAG: hypothetical protein IJY20_07195 [Clostridia bacterium]|nr:hypothetical protein [Clostridia bacterium]